MSKFELWQLIIGGSSVLILIITAKIIYDYTRHTYNLFKETEKQTKLSLRPFVIFSTKKVLKKKDSTVIHSENMPCLENIGKSVAVDVEVDILKICEKIKFNFYVESCKISYILPDNGTELSIRIKTDVDKNTLEEIKNASQTVEVNLMECLKNGKGDFEIKYKNIIAQELKTKVEFENGEIKNIPII